MKGAALPSWPVVYRRLTCLALCFGFAILGASQAAAGSIVALPQNSAVGANEQQIRIDIPRQSMLDALELFARQSQIQVLYKTTAVQSHFSPGVSGFMTASQALQRLLDGTGLSATFVGTRSIAVSSISNDMAPPLTATSLVTPVPTLTLSPLHVQAPASYLLMYEAYARVVQARIRSVLPSGAVEGLRGEGIKFMVWVDAQGVIQKSAIAFSSGSNRIDQQVLDSVRGLSVQEDPPAGFPQPLHIHIHSRG